MSLHSQLSNFKIEFASIPLTSFLINININQITLFLSMIIIILLGLVIYLLKSKRDLLISFNKIEQQLLLTQINPHFIFNSLTAIQSFIFRNEPNQAGKYLSSFAKLIRFIIESSKLEITTIEREIKILQLYFDLQTLRFEGKFDYKIEIDETIDIDEISIPPMLAQPFIENSIEHGFIQLSENGVITVRFKKGEKSIIIEVEDNGIGIEESKFVHLKSGKSHQTLAAEITSQRLKKIRQIRNIDIKIDIIDLNSDNISKKGTIVIFTIPVKD
ncbi:MAG: histidine kinase [Bacteroidales bacterium]|nr:histidine kinase [Bacteroidales bacterium]